MRKVIQDFAGHYNRPDLFTLTLNTVSPSLFQARGLSAQIWQEAEPKEQVQIEGQSSPTAKPTER